MSDVRAPATPPLNSNPAQDELLRRGLVRVSIAADGLTPLLDRRLKELRLALRSDAPSHLLEELLPDLEHAVLAADTDRQARLKSISQSLKNLVRQMHRQESSAEASDALRQLIKRLDQPITYLDGLSGLIDDLAAAQASSGGQAPSAKGGLWSKLFGGAPDQAAEPKDQAHPEVEEQASSQPPSDAQPVLRETAALTDALLPDEDADPAAQAEVATSTEALADTALPGTADSATQVLSGEAQQYSAIASHVETILLGLLDELEVLDSQQPRHQRVREQVQSGLNWYELAAVLDEVSALVLAAQRSRQSEFERYLQQLNARLAQFQGSLERAQGAYTDSLDSGLALEGTIRQQVQTLHEDVRGSTDLNALKATVQAKLDELLVNVDQARSLREQRESEVATHLQTMVERIQVMEVEAQTFRRHLDEQTRRSMLDTLTGLANRAGLEKRMEEEFERWQRYGGQLLLAVLDVDHFKMINDQFGHLAGDKVLRLIAQQLQRRLRKTDFIGRFGGEEFVLLMPGTSVEQGSVVLEELRAGISECPFHFKSQRVPITLSLGYTAVREGDALDQIFDRADQAMYRAKSAGRNRIVQAD